jgi:type II secretory pathway pseudopilin PulG
VEVAAGPNIPTSTHAANPPSTDAESEPAAEAIEKPTEWRTVAAAAIVALLALLGLAVLLIKPDEATTAPAASLATRATSTQLTGEALRDKAAEDLRQRIERLPAQAAPPVNTFYYDVTVNMNEAPSVRTPWTAVIRGAENTIQPDTGTTVARTDFTINADYTDGAWTYRAYHGLTTDLQQSTTLEAVHDEQTPMPPTIVGMLGLRRANQQQSPFSVGR